MGGLPQEHKRSHLEIMKLVEGLKDTRLTDPDIKKLSEQPIDIFLDQILSQDMRFAAFINRNKERMGIQ